jgi:hypothetical protein
MIDYLFFGVVYGIPNVANSNKIPKFGISSDNF